MTEAAIQTTDLTRDFGSVRAVDHLTLDVPPGIIFGFLGPNGSGKTTTIHLLLGLLEATTGQARVLGLDPRTQGDQIRTRWGALLDSLDSTSVSPPKITSSSTAASGAFRPPNARRASKSFLPTSISTIAALSASVPGAVA